MPCRRSRNSKGEPTGAVLGVLNMLNKLIKDEAPARIAVVFDAPGRTFRDDLFDQYKAHRPPMPDDLRSQVQPLLDAVAAMGLPLLRISGRRSGRRDRHAGAARRRGAGYTVLISTGDKDMAQLVGPQIELVNTMSNTRLDRAGVKAKFDVFPGADRRLPRAGRATARTTFRASPASGPRPRRNGCNQYGTLDALIAHAADIAGKVGENLRNELPMLELSRKLATIDTGRATRSDAG